MLLGVLLVLVVVLAGTHAMPQQVRTHAAVLRAARAEAELPPPLRNNFFRDPRTARALARASWLHAGETPVQNREAEKISRREIYNVLVHAGFLPRRSSPDRLQQL